MTPRQYSLVYHVAHGVPADWINDPSYYGPLATAEQLIAAKLAGVSRGQAGVLAEAMERDRVRGGGADRWT